MKQTNKLQLYSQTQNLAEKSFAKCQQLSLFKALFVSYEDKNFFGAYRKT
jgi:hypothetical protein